METIIFSLTQQTVILSLPSAVTSVEDLTSRPDDEFRKQSHSKPYPSNFRWQKWQKNHLLGSKIPNYLSLHSSCKPQGGHLSWFMSSLLTTAQQPQGASETPCMWPVSVGNSPRELFLRSLVFQWGKGSTGLGPANEKKWNKHEILERVPGLLLITLIPVFWAQEKWAHPISSVLCKAGLWCAFTPSSHNYSHLSLLSFSVIRSLPPLRFQKKGNTHKHTNMVLSVSLGAVNQEFTC